VKPGKQAPFVPGVLFVGAGVGDGTGAGVGDGAGGFAGLRFRLGACALLGAGLPFLGFALFLALGCFLPLFVLATT
jgi:hypothetical protein